MELNAAVAQKVLDTVDAGLSHGLGNPRPGQMCVEAAVCYALGMPHGDDPACVGKAVRAFKIRLNDSNWSSKAARAKGLRRIAIAQLGSDRIDQREFARLLVIETIKQIVPITLRAAASVQKDTEKAMALEVAALRCEQEGTREAALDAKTAYAASAYAAYAAYAAASAAYAAASAASAADAAAVKRDSVLSLMANIGVDILIKLGTQGSQWLSLAD